MFISCFPSSDVPRALPTSSVRPFDRRKELEWLPACLYFLNLMRKYLSWKTRQRDKSLSLYSHYWLHLSKSLCQIKLFKKETQVVCLRQLLVLTKHLGMVFLTLSILKSSKDNTIFWPAWFLWVASAPSHTWVLSHNRWNTDKYNIVCVCVCVRACRMGGRGWDSKIFMKQKSWWFFSTA